MKHAQPMPSLMLKVKLAQKAQPPRDFIGVLREAVRAAGALLLPAFQDLHRSA